ncbi:MAG: hypothetical protein J5I93_14595 [Pirellulaceae bacterium]|nr:hypothetical protein [Pirellulaceae bacterium]
MRIAKNQNTFAKRQREMDKRAKAEAKRARRTNRKLHGGPNTADQPEWPDDESLDAEPLDEESSGNAADESGSPA